MNSLSSALRTYRSGHVEYTRHDSPVFSGPSPTGYLLRHRLSVFIFFHSKLLITYQLPCQQMKSISYFYGFYSMQALMQNTQQHHFGDKRHKFTRASARKDHLMACVPVTSRDSIYNFRAPCLFSSTPLPPSPHLPSLSFFFSLSPSVFSIPFISFCAQTLTSWWHSGCQHSRLPSPRLQEERFHPPSDSCRNPGPNFIGTNLTIFPSLGQLLWPRGLEMLSPMRGTFPCHPLVLG